MDAPTVPETWRACVTGVCSARNVELVRSLGAHHVVDYTSGPMLPDGETYDLIFDTVGATTFAGSKPALTAKGVYLPGGQAQARERGGDDGGAGGVDVDRPRHVMYTFGRTLVNLAL